MAKYDGKRRTIGELLALTSPPLVVPDWQRPYRWEASDIEAFWNDLITFSNQYPGNNIDDQEYFLGSVVLVEGKTPHELLDGQQRLATATILLSVLRDYQEKYSPEAASGLVRDFIVKKDHAANMDTYKLTLGYYDWEFFRQEIQQPRTKDWVELKPIYSSHYLIRRARSYFQQQVQENFKRLNGGRAAFDWALRVQFVLTDHMSVVAVSSTDSENAASVFETLNDRGIGLSTTDLLRTLLLRRGRVQDREEINSAWETILQLDKHVEEFLRHYWLSYFGDLKTRKLYKEMKSRIEEENENALALSRSLEASALIYRDLVDAKDEDEIIAGYLGDINDLGAKVLLPILLSTASVSGDDNRRPLIKALISLFVRYNVIGNLEGTRMEAFLYAQARELRKTGDRSATIIAVKEFAPSDDDFVQRFGQASVSRQATARYLLRQIEYQKQRTGELKIETPAKVHLEHIYPQNPPPDRKRGDHEAMVHRIGNMTLLAAPLNQAIGNGSFAEKQGAYKASLILITNELPEFDEWSSTTITQRQLRFASMATAIWGFDDPLAKRRRPGRGHQQRPVKPEKPNSPTRPGTSGGRAEARTRRRKVE